MPRGDAICYIQRDTVLTVAFGSGPHPGLGQPRTLFATAAKEFSLRQSGSEGHPVCPDPGGSRFIGVRETGAPAPRSILFIQNWLPASSRR
jgi:hypothetical protein